MTDSTTDAGATAIREIQPADRDAWAALFRGYRDFYALEHDDGVIDTVWAWLVDPDHELHGLLALRDGIPVGIAHWRRFARPSRGGTAIFLDDLFVAPDVRGGGVGSAAPPSSWAPTLGAMSDFPTARWCRSRRAGAVCTRPAGHPGLHNRQGTGQMWSDREADPPRCEGSGTDASPAAPLADGFPHGDALCPVCCTT